MNNIRNLELLSPAKDLECGLAAINYGADAVYIGAPRFGARAAAGNPVEHIEKLVNYAHKFHAKVYVTLNTILYDRELNEARNMLLQLYNTGIDALIIQDMSFLEMDLPPLPLFASTQTHNYSPERIRFLEACGIKRVILARELSLDQIKNIRAAASIELESFIHGALCVCYSGQCYLSHALSGRSANRGECMQACRMIYSLEDKKGKILLKDKYLLSLRDLNLSDYLQQLIDAGITSFKIEGRLKDISYVKNITAFYRRKLDAILSMEGYAEGFCKASSGKIFYGFKPGPDKTFNRGYTTYFIMGRTGRMASFNTQKSTGEFLGRVKSVSKDHFILDSGENLNNGDGICFFDNENNLRGINVNKAEGVKIFVRDMERISPGLKVFRNHDHSFCKELKKDSTKRQIGVDFVFRFENGQLILAAADEDGNSAVSQLDSVDTPAGNSEKMIETINKQLGKTGETDFYLREIKQGTDGSPMFVPLSRLNDLRRSVLQKLEEERLRNYTRSISVIEKNNIPYPSDTLDYRGNVVNKLSRTFYERHDVKKIDNGFELLNNYNGKTVMTCRYCIKKELGLCERFPDSKEGETELIGSFAEPLYLRDRKRKYRLVFNCTNCEMSLIFEV